MTVPIPDIFVLGWAHSLPSLLAKSPYETQNPPSQSPRFPAMSSRHHHSHSHNTQSSPLWAKECLHACLANKHSVFLSDVVDASTPTRITKSGLPSLSPRASGHSSTTTTTFTASSSAVLSRFGGAIYSPSSSSPTSPSPPLLVDILTEDRLHARSRLVLAVVDPRAPPSVLVAIAEELRGPRAAAGSLLLVILDAYAPSAHNAPHPEHVPSSSSSSSSHITDIFTSLAEESNHARGYLASLAIAMNVPVYSSISFAISEAHKRLTRKAPPSPKLPPPKAPTPPPTIDVCLLLYIL